MFENVGTVVMIIYLIILLLSIIFLTLFVLLVYSGLFNTIDIGTGKPPFGQMVIAYKFQRGPYNTSGHLFTEAAIIAPDNKALGIYYDNPNNVESHALRYVVGSILSEGSSPIDENMVKKFTEKGFKILHLPEVAYTVMTKFPHITTMSILIGIYKAYPRLTEYIEEHKLCAYPFLEYYDGTSIHFVAPLSKQDDFFVSECGMEKEGDDATTEFESTLNTSHSTIDDSKCSQDHSQTALSDTLSSADNAETSVEKSQSLLGSKDKMAAPVTHAAVTSAGTEAADVGCDLNENNSTVSEGSSLGLNDSALADDEQTVSDGDSSSSFELLKGDMDSSITTS